MMIDPSQPIYKDFMDLEEAFDSNDYAKLEFDFLSFEAYRVPDNTYTFRVRHLEQDRIVSLVFGVTEDQLENALFNTQKLDMNPELLKELVPTRH